MIMTSTAPNPALSDKVKSNDTGQFTNCTSRLLRDNSEGWVSSLKREISQPENVDPSVFDDAEEEDTHVPSMESNASGLELLRFAIAREESDRSAPNLTTSALSFGCEATKQTSLSFPLEIKEQRKKSVEILREMGVLDSASKSTDSYVEKRLREKNTAQVTIKKRNPVSNE